MCPLLIIGPVLIVTALIFFDVEYKDCPARLVSETELAINIDSTSQNRPTIDTTISGAHLVVMTSPDPNDGGATDNDTIFVRMTSRGAYNAHEAGDCALEMTSKCDKFIHV